MENTCTEIVEYDADDMHSEFRRMRDDCSAPKDGDGRIKKSGTTIPFRLRRAKTNKKQESDAGSGNGNQRGGSARQESYNMLGIIGSLTGCSGENCVNAGNGKFLFVPMRLTKTANEAHVSFPVSPTTGKPIRHILLTEGEPRMIFTTCGAVTAYANPSILYCACVTATYTAKPPFSGKGAVAASAMQDGVPVSAAAASASSSSSRQGYKQPRSFQRKMSEPEWAVQQQQQDKGTSNSQSSSFSSALQPIAIGTYGTEKLSKEYEIQNITEVIDALSKIDCRDFQGVQVNADIIQAYLDKESPLLNREQRICLEYMHPEIVNINPLPGLVASVALNCEVVVYTQEYDYRNQDIEDAIAYLSKVGDDTLITRPMITGNQECSFTLSALPDAEAEKHERAKQAEKEPVFPSLNAVTIKKKPDPPRAGEVEKGVFSCWSKLTKAESACFWFTAVMQTWPVKTNWMTAIKQKRMFTARLLGSVFSEHLTPAFGITNLLVWKDLAINILSNTSMWIQVTTDRTRTNMLRCNLETPIDRQEIPNIAVHTDGFIVDFAKALEEEIGLPITASGAAAIMTATACCGQGIICKVPEESEVRAAHPEFVPSFVCLSEQPAAFSSTVAAKCKFYALNPVFCRAQFKVKDISPELGSALISADWYTKKDFVLCESRNVVPANDPLRSSVSDAATKAIFLPFSNRTTYVYAIRTKEDRRSSTDRLFASLNVFKHGGNYGENGIPIIQHRDLLRIESGGNQKKDDVDHPVSASAAAASIDAPSQITPVASGSLDSASQALPPPTSVTAASNSGNIDVIGDGDDGQGANVGDENGPVTTHASATQKKSRGLVPRAPVSTKRKTPTGEHEESVPDAKRTKRVGASSSSSSAPRSPSRKST